MSFQGQTVLMSSFRDEAPFVLEFVAHHLMLGFDRILIASNDCTDGTDEILAALDRAGAILHVPCRPGPGESPLNFAHRRIRSLHPVDTAEWLMVLDADEFLNIHVGGGLLPDLIAAQPRGCDLVTVNWACFGASGQTRWRPGFSAELYPRRLATTNTENGMIKSLRRRPAIWGEIGNHHPYDPKVPEVVVSLGAGLTHMRVPAAEMTRGAMNYVKPWAGSLDLAQVNHYASRSRDCFELRRRRGAGSRPLQSANTRHDEAYFRRMSGGRIEDLTIRRYDARFRAAFAGLLALPGVRAAHEAGLAAYEAAIAAWWAEISPSGS